MCCENSETNADDPFLALLSYRATPLPWCGKSPTELLMGRKLRNPQGRHIHSGYRLLLPLPRDHPAKEYHNSECDRNGIPETVVSDNGPQFSSQEFSDFASNYQFAHVTSSPHYPASNGQAERAVKTAKQLLKNADDPFLALLSYRATPLPWCGKSPAELLMGRKLRSNIPQTTDSLVPQWSYLQEFRAQNKEFKKRQKRDYDRRHRVQDLPAIPDNTDVWVTTGGSPTPGRIITTTDTP